MCSARSSRAVRCQAAGVTIERADLVRDLDRLQEATIDKDGKRITTRTPVTGLPGDRRDEAEVCFRQALAVTRGQGARFLELRTVVSLARIRCDSGRPDEARTLLAPDYGRFSEGFDTPDLQEAKALLGE